MKPLDQAKLGLAASGLVTWGYGVKADAPLPTWFGIGMLVVAVAMRFYRPRSPEG